MTGRDLLREVVGSLRAHRLRTLLAVTGIVAGVATIIAALAVAEGARRQAIEDIGALGTDNVIVRAHERTGAKDDRLAPLLTLSDARGLAAHFPGAEASALRLMQDTLTAGNRAVAAAVAGVTPTWTATGIGVARGRWFSTADAHDRCAVLGYALARTLYGDGDPIGQTLVAAGEWRTVIGVLADGAARPRSSLQILSADDAIFVPFETLDVSLGAGDTGEAADEVVIRLPHGDDPALAAGEATRLLGELHEGDGAASDVLVPRELLRARLRAQRSSQILLLAVGALTILISGVGIMNIMVASVTERAPEIGVRRAVGARRRSVLLQFAAEAAVLGAGGGAIGVPAGALAAWVAARLAGWPVALSAGSVAGALALAVAVALAAGLYPAVLAASVSPIETLR